VYKATATFILKLFPHFTDSGIQMLSLTCPQVPFTVDYVNIT